VPGPQNGRYAAEPLSGLTSLKDFESGRQQYNASAQAAVDIGDTVKKIVGTEVPLTTPWLVKPAKNVEPVVAVTPAPEMAQQAAVIGAAPSIAGGTKPAGLGAPRNGVADDLKQIEGIGPVLEKLVHGLGFFHFDQIAAWDQSQIDWMDLNLKGFKGRVTRDKWVAQAKLIGEIGLAGFLIRAKSNQY
jgi:NADH-quinone oxidoreductase subunit E